MAHPAVPKDFENRFDRSFGLIAFVSNRHLLDHMRRITVELHLDLETAFIWGTLCNLNVAAQLPPGVNPNKALTETGRIPEGTLRPVRLVDLSQITGLPRETVRRKLERLLEAGKVMRDDNGGWTIDPASVDLSLRDFTKESAVRLLSAATEILNVLERVDPHGMVTPSVARFA